MKGGGGGVKLTPPQEKLLSKRGDLLNLKWFFFCLSYFYFAYGVSYGFSFGTNTGNNIFLCYRESILKDYPKDFKAVYYKRSTNNIFPLFNWPGQTFFEYINIKHKNLKVSVGTEINDSLSILDVKIFRSNENFVRRVVRNDTFSGVYTNLIWVQVWFGTHVIMFFLKFNNEFNKEYFCGNAIPQKFTDR